MVTSPINKNWKEQRVPCNYSAQNAQHGNENYQVICEWHYTVTQVMGNSYCMPDETHWDYVSWDGKASKEYRKGSTPNGEVAQIIHTQTRRKGDDQFSINVQTSPRKSSLSEKKHGEVKTVKDDLTLNLISLQFDNVQHTLLSR